MDSPTPEEIEGVQAIQFLLGMDPTGPKAESSEQSLNNWRNMNKGQQEWTLSLYSTLKGKS